MWDTVELREIRTFLALADELHFGRTADRLGLTQSRVSQTLRTLEHKVGGRLVQRTSRHVALTPLGTRLRDEVRPAYDELQQVLQRTHRRSRALAGVLRLGLLSPTSGGPHLNSIIKTFEERHDGVEAQVSEVAFDDPLGPLRHEEIDLLAIRLPIDQPDLVVGPTLSREPRVVAVARDHPLAGRDGVTLDDLADYEVQPLTEEPKELIDALVPRVTPSGRPIVRRRTSWRPRTPHELTTLIARGVVVHPTVPSFIEYFGHPAVVLVPITDMPHSSSGLVWRRRTTDARLRAFVQTTRDVLAQNTPVGPMRRRRATHLAP